MINNKEINRLMEKVLNVPQKYDIRHGIELIKGGLTLREAEEYVQAVELPDVQYSIVSARPAAFCDDIELTLNAVRELSNSNGHTFVLSYDNGVWVASYGNYAYCSEFKGPNPAHVSCVAVLQFIGEL
jgi:hypothetical protein